MAELITASELATRKGVTPAAVSLWKRAGKIVLVGKLVDFAATEALLAATSKRATKQRRPAAKLNIAEMPDVKISVPDTPGDVKLSDDDTEGPAGLEAAPDPAPAAEPVVPPLVSLPVAGEEVDPEVLVQSADAFIQRVLSGQYETMAEAERIKQNALALKHVLDVHERAGRLVNKVLVEREVFDAVRSWRDTWMNWSSKIAPLLAADLGIEPDKLSGLLASYVHRQLLELGEIELDLSEEAT